ncbi:hypothetical protein [Methylobacter marinus]|uniref:hypothetical protein n=1 Tax=Methylobacter marinus TaxID=34058 RepID=UPI0012EC1DDF|nr:hypothetical protein [Methylobacter marinus]
MNRRIMIILLLLVSTCAGAQTLSERPEFSKLRPEVQTLVQTWLNKNCGAAERSMFEKKLTEVGIALEPVFWEAFRLGPTKQELKNLSAAIVKRYEDRQNWLQQFGNTQMGKEEATRQLAISEKQYADREMIQYTQRYKTSALAGLGLIGTQQSEADLNRIADDNSNPAQTAAQEALRAIRR